MIKITEDSIFEASPTLLPKLSKVTGELCEDFYVIPVKCSDGSIIKHFVQSGKFYIREYYLDEQSAWLSYSDYRVDPQTLIDVTDFDSPVFVGCDLAREIDLAYYGGQYYGN